MKTDNAVFTDHEARKGSELRLDREAREGDIYAEVEVFGKHFVLKYGYYDDKDRSGPADVIYPDFEKEPLYTDTGEPFVTMMQDACKSFRGDAKRTADTVCSECKYFLRGKEWFGLCRSPDNNRLIQRENVKREEFDGS